MVKLTEVEEKACSARLSLKNSISATKDSRKIRLYHLKGERTFKGYGPRNSWDQNFRPEGRIPLSRKKRVLASGWKPVKEINKNASLLGSEADHGGQLAKSVFKKIRQGNLGNCPVALSQKMMRTHPRLIRWLLSNNLETDSFWTILLKHGHMWTRVYIQKLVCILENGRSSNVAFMPNIKDCFAPCALEAAVAKLDGPRGFEIMNVGCTFTEAMAKYSEGYSLLFNPSRMDIRDLGILIYKSIARKQLIAVGTKERRDQVRPDLHNGHVMGVRKLIAVEVGGNTLVLALLLEPHGGPVKGPIKPGEPIWELFDGATQGQLMELLDEEEGLMLLPLEAVKRHCDILEVFDVLSLPPDPISNSLSFQWKRRNYHYRRIYGTWDNKPHPQKITHTTPNCQSWVVAILSQVNRSQDTKKKFLRIRLDALDSETNQPLTPAVGDDQAHLALKFCCQPNTSLVLKPSAAAFALAKGPYLLRLFIIEGVEEEVDVPPAIRDYQPNDEIMQQWVQDMARAVETQADLQLGAPPEAGQRVLSGCGIAHTMMWQTPIVDNEEEELEDDDDTTSSSSSSS